MLLHSCKTKKQQLQNTERTSIKENVSVEKEIPAVTETYGLNLGNTAPILIGKNTNDSIINSKSLRGTMVLIDFWASWCGPCRHENPNVVKCYEEFKDKKFKKGSGFTVFGVSLDENKKSWENAIRKDNLQWPYHISDLKGWNSKFALMYNISSIPTNYLIDGDGIIVAKNLRKEELSKTLTRFLEE